MCIEPPLPLDTPAPRPVSSAMTALDLLKEEGGSMYNNTISYEYVKSDGLTSESQFFLFCLICKFCWPSSIYYHINLQNGCPWCKNQAKKLQNYTLYMINFIVTKLYPEKFDLTKNDFNKIYNPKDELIVKCLENGEHDTFKEILSKLLSKAKDKKYKTKGCKECNDSKPKEKTIRWKNNLEALKLKGKQVHGDAYSYELVKPEDIESNRSIIYIKCQIIIENGEICGNVFPQTIHDHLDSATGCTECFKSYKLTRDIFIDKMKKLYEDKFLYHRIKEEDIVNNLSIVEIECAICNFIIDTTSISSFLTGRRECYRCENREKWTFEKLNIKILEKEKEGIYSYEYVKIDGVISGDTIIDIGCITCKEIGIYYPVFRQTLLNHFTSGYGCYRCGGKLKWKAERFMEESLIKSQKGEYSYENVKIEKIIDGDTIIPISCLKCKNNDYEKYIFEKSLYKHFIVGKGCNRCSGNLPWTYERYLDELKRLPDVFKNSYDFSQITTNIFINVNYSTLIPLLCKLCFKITYRSLFEFFTCKRGCKFCRKMSIGAKIVYNTLEKLGIDFETEVNCPGMEVMPYRFDFKFLYYDKIYIVEYDGGNHQQYIPFMHKSIEKFHASRRRDIYKQHYAFQQGYKMIRIDHTIKFGMIEFHINTALASGQQVYYSTNSLYTWLQEGVKYYEENKSFSF